MQLLSSQVNEDAQVLIVDDEQEILNSLKRRFDLEGIEVQTCQNPIEAMNLMMQYHYNIVLSDIKMPGMDGIELLNTIKSVNPLCNVIMMTGYSNMMNVIDCLSSGAYDYFTKPFIDLDVLVRAVRHAIERVNRWKQGI